MAFRSKRTALCTQCAALRTLWSGALREAAHPALAHGLLWLKHAVLAGMIRELALQVMLEENGKWRELGHVWPVGPAASRAVAVPVDLSRTHGKVARIRLESSAGLWSLDRAALEVGEPRIVKPTELRPTTARDSNNQDKRDVLEQADARYFDMLDGERATLSFRAPPPAAGLTRSVFVRASGWYNVHPDATRAPRVDLLGLIAEPGAFGRFSVADVAAHTRGGAK